MPEKTAEKPNNKPPKTAKTEAKEIRTQPDPKELEEIQSRLASEFPPDTLIKFLWNVDDCYRFRINTYSKELSIITSSHFLHVFLKPDGVIYQIVGKNDTDNERIQNVASQKKPPKNTQRLVAKSV